MTSKRNDLSFAFLLTGLSTACMAPVVVLAQASVAPPPPPPAPGAPGNLQDQLTVLRPEAAAYQKCMSEHRHEVDLYYAADGLIKFRDRRAQWENTYQRNPEVRQQYPGGVDRIGAAGFLRYKSLGGTADSIAEIRPVANPCPLPENPASKLQRRAVVPR